jgi:hypothetical protein
MAIEQIGTALGALNSAITIGKAVLDSKGAVERATLNLQVAELTGAVAEAKIALVEIEERVREKDKEIERLNEALENRNKVAKVNDAFYDLDDQGRPTGEPYCMSCYETRKKLVHLARTGPRTHDPKMCPTCKTSYSGYAVSRLAPAAP